MPVDPGPDANQGVPPKDGRKEAQRPMPPARANSAKANAKASDTALARGTATPEGVLAAVFGHDAFRGGQQHSISSVLSGRDTLAVMPTGGGKSLCYQVPALMRSPEEGLTLVISPLVSLMKDQLESLRRRLEDPECVAALHSRVPARERRLVERRVLLGSLRVLYVAPERLRSLEFCLFLKRAAGGAGVSLVVVDEAHCISEWGHSFRPEYLFLGPVIADLASRRANKDAKADAAGPGRRVPILALTATADPRVREDIVGLLGMEDPEEVVTGFDRPNLSYEVRKTHLPPGAARLLAVLELLEDAETPAVIYAHTKRHTEELARGIAEAGTQARPYHAGMPAGEREAVQDAFMGGQLPVICATVAFGMGVDKPDVRTVIHAGVPSSIPAYAQETGRAGRDGDPASCVVLFSDEELRARRELASLRNADVSDARRYLDALLAVATSAMSPPASGAAEDHSPELRRANVPLVELFDLAGVAPERAQDVARALERIGKIRRRYNLWAAVRVRCVSPDASRALDLGLAASKVHASLLAHASAVEDRALNYAEGRSEGRGRGGIVPLPEIARDSGLSPASAQVALSRLVAAGLAEISPSGGAVSDVLIKPGPLSAAEERLLSEVLGAQARAARAHLDAIGRYANLTTCRREHLLSHFGDSAASGAAPCGGCDVCNPRTGRGSRPSLGRRALAALAAVFGTTRS